MASQLYNYRSADIVLEEMTSLFAILQPDVNVNEASPMYFLFQMFAYITAQNNDLALQFANAAFIATAEGDDLTDLSADRGVTRKDSEYATLVLEFSRATTGDAITIPASSLFATEADDTGSSIQYKTFNAITMPATALTASVYAQATTGGADGNAALGTVTEFIYNPVGIDTVSNITVGIGGVDEETDTALRERLIDVLQNNTGRVTTSGYRQYLESLAGVESASVYPGSGAMPNYITAVVTTTANETGIPTAGQLATWTALVNGDDNRAVVDVIEVVAPEAVEITVDATINEFVDGAGETATKTRIQESVIDFINALRPGTTVRFNDISNIIHDDSGVVDFTLTTPTTNTTITELQKSTASTSTVTIS